MVSWSCAPLFKKCKESFLWKHVSCNDPVAAAQITRSCWRTESWSHVQPQGVWTNHVHTLPMCFVVVKAPKLRWFVKACPEPDMSYFCPAVCKEKCCDDCCRVIHSLQLPHMCVSKCRICIVSLKILAFNLACGFQINIYILPHCFSARLPIQSACIVYKLIMSNIGLSCS